MDEIVVYSTVSNPRIIYVLDWLLKERLQIPYRLEVQEAGAGGSSRLQEDINRGEASICYGIYKEGCICVPWAGLLGETGIEWKNPAVGDWNEIPTIFAVEGWGRDYMPFDILSAIFYLLSRYEEYLDGDEKDKHGRYMANDSILYRNGWLQRPIVDEWVHAFRRELERTLQVKLPPPVFSFCATYDIDIAYSHLHKGVGRIAGAFLRALLHADLKQVSQRSRVLRKKQKDPYDSFRWMRQIHKEYSVSPTYFVLAALRTTRFDKNIHPQHPAMVRVIKNIAKEGKLGIHPSYYSQEGDTLQQEKKIVEQIAGHGTTLSRQHYIRAVLPHTYRALISHGITDDYSMGYGTHLGFRAGTGCPFYWYDLEKEQVTALRVHPFCFMDTTAHYEARLEAQQAFERLEAMTEVLRRTGSVLVTVFHNFSLGTADEWRGWRQAYELFLHTTIRAGIGSMKVPANR